MDNRERTRAYSTRPTTRQGRFIAEHMTCAMCESNLEIRHDINKNDLKVTEEAHCPSCGIRVRSLHHLMH